LPLATAMNTASTSEDESDRKRILARFRSEEDLVDLNARQIWRRMGAGCSITLDDLQSFGREGLFHASRTFDESRGLPFRRWANLRIRGAIIDGVRLWGFLPRRVYRLLSTLESVNEPVAASEQGEMRSVAARSAEDPIISHMAAAATAMAVREATGDRGPERLLVRAQTAARVRAAVARLPDCERALVEKHDLEEETLERAAASLGLSKSWGSRLRARAIGRLADDLRDIEVA
jgi:RNA polymerase sigma factor for flagellar operon FliA